MKITELTESSNNSKAVFSFMRMNPPHLGHQKLIEKVITEAQALGCPYYIMVSHTVDKKKNPLPYDVKMKFIKRLFPSVNFVDGITFDKGGETKAVKTPFEMLEYLCQHGATDVVMVVGEDRVENFKNMIQPYVGKDFNLNSFDVVSAGQRQGEGIDEKASGTLVRQLVNLDMKDDFNKLIPSNDQTLKDELFNTLKEYL